MWSGIMPTFTCFKKRPSLSKNTTLPVSCGLTAFSTAVATTPFLTATELILPYAVSDMDASKVGLEGLIKFTISSFPPMLFAIYRRCVVGSCATISAELLPVIEFEKLDRRFNVKPLFATGILESLSLIYKVH